jgi:hypothetical protein
MLNYKMAKRKTRSKTNKVKRGKVTRKTMKRKSRKDSKKRSKSKKVSKILSSTYGLGAMYKKSEKSYKKTPRVYNVDPYKIKKSKSKSAKASFLAGIDSGPKQSKGSWLSHVKKVYEEGKKSVPGYKYKDAMKDAKKTW